MRILVLSDLHIGKKARGKDLCPNGDNDWLDENYKIDFINYIHSEKIRVDYLIITGDISNTATFQEFSLGNNLIDEISQELNLDKSKVLIIPGNHDVDWEVLKLADPKNPDDLKFRKSQRYDSLKHGLINWNIDEFLENPYFKSWIFKDLFVLGFNSAWHDENDVNVHHGLITDDIIQKMDAHIHAQDLTNKVKLFITHHHLFQYSDPLSIDPDFSIMVHSEKLLRMLAKNKFDMITHGHKHIPRIITQEIDCIHPLSMLCAGSFSVKLDQRLNGTILNMFHIINFEGRDKETDKIYGYIENYSYLSTHKWIKSLKNNSNILYKQGFGAYASIKALKEKLSPIIQGQVNNQGSACWSKLCRQYPSLSYHPAEFISQLTDEIRDDLVLEKHEIENEIIFIKP
jgi:predicted phosphodiesterase